MSGGGVSSGLIPPGSWWPLCLLASAALGADKAAPKPAVVLTLPPLKAPKPAPFPALVGDPVESAFVQVFPRLYPEGLWLRSAAQGRAVVLIHGFHIFPFRKGYANHATFHSWQKPGSKLVDVLSRQADVYAFAYSQNVAIDEIAGVPRLADGIRRLKALGYSQIVLIGHSGGGLVARQFVEDYPEAGVTKVIQVCAPNGGTNYAQFEPGVQKSQKVFLRSLTKDARNQAGKDRLTKPIPETIQFACVVGVGVGQGDGVVSKESQWPADFQAQGIPAVILRTTHFTVMRSTADTQRLAELVRAPLPRNKKG